MRAAQIEYHGDTLTPEERSKRMSLVRSKDTKAEMLVRRLVHAMGYRYRLHVRALPGTPDLTFRRRKKVIFVHGCFWHRHQGCSRCRIPKSRHDFWVPKLEGNRVRDEQQQRRLQEAGWDVLVVWECEVDNMKALAAKIQSFLEG